MKKNNEQIELPGIEKAGMRVSVYETKYARDLVQRLNLYENEWLKRTGKYPMIDAFDEIREVM